MIEIILLRFGVLLLYFLNEKVPLTKLLFLQSHDPLFVLFTCLGLRMPVGSCRGSADEMLCMLSCGCKGVVLAFY